MAASDHLAPPSPLHLEPGPGRGRAGRCRIRRRAQGTNSALERALDEGLGAGWRDGVDADLAARLGRRPSLARILFAPISLRRHGVKRMANIRYGPARRGNLLDLYRDRANRSARPTLIYLHAELSASAASVWEHVTCSIGSPARAGVRQRKLPAAFGGFGRSADRREEGDRLGT